MSFTTQSRDKAATTRQQKREEKLANQIAAGIPDSPILTRPAVENDNPILNLHVGGILVSTMLAELPESMAAIVLSGLAYQATDEGIAASNVGKEPQRVSVGDGPFEKALDQRRDDVKVRDMDTYEARDPLKEVADQYAVAGMRPKFLSARKVKENGGTGDYQVVKDAHGDPVQVRGMILGQMPEAKAKARNRHYQEKGNRLLGEMTAKYKAEGGPTAVSDQ